MVETFRLSIHIFSVYDDVLKFRVSDRSQSIQNNYEQETRGPRRPACGA